MKALAAIVLAGILSSCSSQTPYYLSGINVGVDQANGGTGATLGFTFQPDPNWKPLPHYPK